MSFIQRWNADDIKQQLARCAGQMNNNYNDGFTQWGCKKDLLDVKYYLDELLRKAPEFAGEAEYVQAQEQQRAWNILQHK